MPALNRIQLIGRLGKDPETRQTPTGKKVCSFSMAVNRRQGGDDTNGSADWFNIDVWGRLGEICQEYLHKGRLVFVEGRLKTDRVEQNGQVKYYTKVISSQMQMLDRHVGDVQAEEEDSEEE